MPSKPNGTGLLTAAKYCALFLVCYVLAFVLSPPDPATVWPYFVAISLVAVFVSWRLKLLPCRIPRQYSIRSLLTLFVITAILLSVLAPYLRGMQVTASADNVISFRDESLAEEASCIRYMMYTMPSGLQVAIEPASHGSKPGTDENSLVVCIEVRSYDVWWNRLWTRGEQCFSPYTRDEFIRALEAEYDSNLGTPGAARVERLTLGAGDE